MATYIQNVSKHPYECSQGEFKIMPKYQTNDYTLLQIRENKFIDKFKPKLNKTWINFFYLLRTFCPRLGSFFLLFVFVCVLFLLSLRFGQISPLAFFRWFLPRPRIRMLSLVTVSPVITAFHSCCLSYHVFDQVNLWPIWVGFDKTQHSYPRSR